MARQTDKVKLNPDSFQKAKKIFRFLKPYKGIYFLGWIFLLLSSLTAMVFPALMGQLLGADTSEKALIQFGNLDFNNVNILLLFMLIVFAFQAVFSFFRVVVFNKVTENVLRDIKQESFRTFVHLPMNFFNRNKVGELTSRIATDIQLLQETFNTTIAEFFRQIVTIIFALTVIFFLSWQLALWMLAVVPVLAIVAIIFGRYIRTLSKKAQDESAASNSVLEEVLIGIFNVKAFTNERLEENRFNDRIAEVLRQNIKSGIMRGLFVSFIIFCMFGGVAFVIWKAKSMQNDGEITAAAFNAFILYTIFLGASFGSIPDLYAKIQKAIGSTERLMTILEEKPEEEKPGQEINSFSGRVSFKNVSFSYAQRKEIEVLKGVSFECYPGQVTALVGSSGSGKSTISSLLLKFYKPDSGEILFDDMNVENLSNKSLRSQIAVVPQEVILFGGTIFENIQYGRPDATKEEVEEAARKANAYDFIQSFPEKFNTLVGDRGIQLSGGQRQRIAIARAVLKNPKLLILDEATSALDSESEKLVQDALNKLMKGCTSIVIAHRLSTIQNADNILVMESGKIAEQGTHSRLIHQGGIYTRLQNLQKKEELN
ncbi:MAG: ABC transporter ATP-binding protein [Crocinitomicaceae bacterium]|nr:ABC transporter ATP-binding protein [Crocinitomicaceae bacterium]